MKKDNLILIHDFAGHPFQVELSRSLAARGYRVYHMYFSGDQGPKGDMRNQLFESGELIFIPVDIDRGYSKTNFLSRFLSDLIYAKYAKRKILEINPDIVISGNSPTWVQRSLLKATIKINAKFIYWCQDFYSIAVSTYLKRKSSLLGMMAEKVLKKMDKNQMSFSDHIILITDYFLLTVDAWKIPRSKVSIIPNWGPLDLIGITDKNNSWVSSKNLQASRKRVVYSGTLALKHNPDLIAFAAKKLPDVDFIIVSSGVGAEYLESLSLPNIYVFSLEPVENLQYVLGSADVLIAVIENDAGEFSVPSKVLSYFCACRPIVLAAPASNLASRIVMKSNAGLVVSPDSYNDFFHSISSLLSDVNLACELSNNGRKYAENNFNIDHISQKFESLIDSCIDI